MAYTNRRTKFSAVTCFFVDVRRSATEWTRNGRYFYVSKRLRWKNPTCSNAQFLKRTNVSFARWTRSILIFRQIFSDFLFVKKLRVNWGIARLENRFARDRFTAAGTRKIFCLSPPQQREYSMPPSETRPTQSFHVVVVVCRRFTRISFLFPLSIRARGGYRRPAIALMSSPNTSHTKSSTVFRYNRECKKYVWGGRWKEREKNVLL